MKKYPKPETRKKEKGWGEERWRKNGNHSKNMERLRERDAPGNSWTGWLKIQVVDHPGWWKPKHRRSSLSLSPTIEAATRLWVIVVKILPEIRNFSGQVISDISPLWQGFAMISVRILDNGVMMWKILHLILWIFIGYMIRKIYLQKKTKTRI